MVDYMEINEGDVIVCHDSRGMVRNLHVEEKDFDGEPTPILYCVDGDGQEYGLTIDDESSIIHVTRNGVML